MSLGNFVKENAGKLGGSAAGLGALWLLLRDAIGKAVGELWSDYLKTRETKRQAMLAAAQSGNKIQDELISLIKVDLEARRVTESRIFELMERLTKAQEKQASANAACAGRHGAALNRILENQAAMKEALLRKPQQAGG